MATESFAGSFVEFPEFDENLLTCEICTKLFKQAKVLNCGHTFCRECLEKWAETNVNEGKEATCPNCRTLWKMPAGGIEKLPTNYVATSMVNFITTSREKVLMSEVGRPTGAKACELCESKEVTSACVECRQQACDACVKVHQRTKATMGHQVVSLEEYGAHYENYPARLNPSECSQHAGIQLKYYCQTCSVPTCLECTITEHRVPEHKHIYMSEAARDARNLINGTQIKVTDRLQYLNEKRATMQRIKEKLTHSMEQAIIGVKQQTQELVKNFQENENKMVKNINDKYQEKLIILDSHLDKIDLNMGQVKSTFEHSKNQVEQGTDVELMSVHNQSQDMLENLLNEEMQVDPRAIYQLYYSSEPAFANGNQGNVQSLPLLTVNVSGSKGDKPGQFNWPSGVAASKFGDLYVTDINNYRIQVFDMNGEYKRHFNVYCEGKRVRPSDVAFNREDHLVIADSAGQQICVCDTDGKLLRQFGKGELEEPRLLAVSSDGHIHVTDWGGNSVKTFTPEGGLVRTIGNKGDQPGQFNNAHSVAINSKDQIIVSDDIIDYNNRVQVFDSDGTFLFACEKEVEGELQGPRGVTVDRYDNIIVCDWANDRIHMFSPEGVFIGHVDDPCDGVMRPQAITTVPGHPLKLVVTEFDDNIKHFKLRIMQSKY